MFSRLNPIVSIAGAALFLSLSLGAHAAGDPAQGEKKFYTCYGCHGFSGQNGNGARLVPMKFPQAGFIAYVRNPPRANQMPSFSAKVLADKDLGDIYAYIKTLPDSAPPAESWSSELPYDALSGNAAACGSWRPAQARP